MKTKCPHRSQTRVDAFFSYPPPHTLRVAPRMSTAERQRRLRVRRRAGVVVLRIEVSAFELSELLIEAGFLGFDDRENKRQIELALAAYLQAISMYE